MFRFHFLCQVLCMRNSTTFSMFLERTHKLLMKIVIVIVHSAMMGIVSRYSTVRWTCTGAWDICYVSHPNSIQRQLKICFRPGMFPLFVVYYIPCEKKSILFHYPVQLLGGALLFRYSLFFEWASTIFQCPKSRLFSEHDNITFEQCVNEDVTASSYASDPLLHARDSVPIHGVPPPKRIKRIWKKLTKSKKDFSSNLWVGAWCFWTSPGT